MTVWTVDLSRITATHVNGPVVKFPTRPPDVDQAVVTNAPGDADHPALARGAAEAIRRADEDDAFARAW